MGRVRLAEKNIIFGYIGQLATALISFVLRTIFIRNLAEQLLGVNSLYTNILSILSMAELGIGTALNFALYRPVAEHDREKVKSYMQMYRKAYYIIALVVAGIGLAIAPFLRFLIKDPGPVTVQQMTLYYFIFLFNTVSTYFVSYKYSLVNAQQKNYIQTNINTVTKIITALLQILVVVLTKNFLLYLITDALVQLLQKIFVNWYLNRLYPFLLEKDIAPLSKEESDEVWRKTRALVLHKVGDVARLQTDSIIISSFIAVAVSGMVDNYTLVINTVSNFVNIIFNSVISGFGNLIATESKQRQFELFKVYRFFAELGLRLRGNRVLYSADAAYPDLVRGRLGAAVIGCISDPDRPVFQGRQNCSVQLQNRGRCFRTGQIPRAYSGCGESCSVGLARADIYVGTVVSGLIANVTKPVIIYRVCFDRSPASYFADTAKYVVTVAVIILASRFITAPLLASPGIVPFLVCVVLITALFNAVFLLLFGRTQEMRYLKGLLKNRLSKGEK